jgi:hypothetical protein
MGGPVRCGLTARELASLAVRELDADLDEEQRCCICCCEFVAHDKLMKLRCGHEFHVECIETWLRAKRACPVCKQDAAHPDGQAADADDDDDE